jgi:uncharacterized protein YndB with AHSA1/START domain
MPRQKDFKRLVRTRMLKTGESYTAARARLLAKSGTRPSSSENGRRAPHTPAQPSKPDYAALAGMSDATVKAKTGCTWERWVTALDYHGAATMSHRDIAQLVRDKYKVGPWWTQMVTVGYERITGLRARGQRRDGTYEAAKSRTVPVAVTKLYDAWAAPAKRRGWLDGATFTVRTRIRPKSMRLGFDDGSIAVIYFESKGKSKSTVSVQHTKLPDKEAADQLKQFWGERLDALSRSLGAP